MSSKRKNMNFRRRQIRRVLNRFPEALHGAGYSKIRRLGYGAGLSASHLREYKQIEE